MSARDWLAELDPYEAGRAVAWVCAGFLVALFLLAGVMAVSSGSTGAGLLAVLALVPTLCACALAARWDVFAGVLFGVVSSSSADAAEQDAGSAFDPPRAGRTLDD